MSTCSKPHYDKSPFIQSGLTTAKKLIDPFGRELSYLRISVTDKCNLRCRYCMPKEGVASVEHHSLLSFEEIITIVQSAVSLGLKKVRLTGGEPLVRRGVGKLIRLLGEIDEIDELLMTTNGVFLKKFIPDLLDAGIKRVNISLDTLNGERYHSLTRGGDLQTVLEAIDACIEFGIDIKLNQVLWEGISKDDIDSLTQFTQEKGLEIQRIGYFHLNQNKIEQQKHFIHPNYHKKPERPYPCETCNRLRLMADGQLKSCLHSKKGVQVDMNDIEASFFKAVSIKPEEGHCSSFSSLSSIGG